MWALPVPEKLSSQSLSQCCPLKHHCVPTFTSGKANQNSTHSPPAPFPSCLPELHKQRQREPTGTASGPRAAALPPFHWTRSTLSPGSPPALPREAHARRPLPGRAGAAVHPLAGTLGTRVSEGAYRLYSEMTPATRPGNRPQRRNSAGLTRQQRSPQCRRPAVSGGGVIWLSTADMALCRDVTCHLNGGLTHGI